MKTAPYKILLTVIIISFLASSEIISQHLPDSLEGYLEIAAKNNPGVRQKLLEYQAALQKAPQVGSLPDPELSAGVFFKPMELVSGNQIADLQLMQMFPWFGVLKNAKDEESLMAKAKFELFRDARAQVFYDVQKTWFELYGILEERRISEKNIGILKTIERLSLVRFKSPSSGSAVSQPTGPMSAAASQSGVAASSSEMQKMNGSQTNQNIAATTSIVSLMQSSSMGTSSGGSGLSDLYRIQIEIIGLENDIASLKNQERTLIARFNSFLNRDPLSSVFVDSILQNPSLALSEIMGNDSILSDNPMLSMLDYEIQSLEARKRMVKGMGFPMVGLGINYSLIKKSSMSSSSMNGTDMLMPMVSVTLPVYRKKYNAMKYETDLAKSAAEQNHKAIVNSLIAEFYGAIQLYQDASRRAKLYEEQRILASRIFDLLLTDFSTSASSLVDVLRIWQQLLDYELNLVKSNVDMNIASAWIKRIMTSENKQ